MVEDDRHGIRVSLYTRFWHSRRLPFQPARKRQEQMAEAVYGGGAIGRGGGGVQYSALPHVAIRRGSMVGVARTGGVGYLNIFS
jgi:hypothetical protein